VDEFRKELGFRMVARGGVLVDEVAAAAREHLAHRGGHEHCGVEGHFNRAEIGAQVVLRAKGAAFVGVDVEGFGAEVARGHELARQADGLELDAAALRDKQVDGRERQRDASAAANDLVEKAVARVVVVLGLAAKTVFVKEHAVEDEAFVARARGREEQLPAAGRRGVEKTMRVNGAERRENRALKQQQARLQFVLKGADELHEHLHGVFAAEFAQKAAGVYSQRSISAVGRFAQKFQAWFALTAQFLEQRLTHLGRGVVQEGAQSPGSRGGQSFGGHGG